MIISQYVKFLLLEYIVKVKEEICNMFKTKVVSLFLISLYIILHYLSYSSKVSKAGNTILHLIAWNMTVFQIIISYFNLPLQQSAGMLHKSLESKF